MDQLKLMLLQQVLNSLNLNNQLPVDPEIWVIMAKVVSFIPDSKLLLLPGFNVEFVKFDSEGVFIDLF